MSNSKDEYWADGMMETKEPLNWTRCKLGEVASVKNGFAFKSAEFTDTGVPIIRISDINSSVVSCVNSVKTTRRDQYKNFKVEYGDILIAMSGATTGKFGVYKEPSVAYQNQRVGNIRPLNANLNKSFLFYYIFNARRQIEKEAYGGAQPNISSKKIEQLDFLLPPLDEQKRIVAKIEELFSELDSGIASLKTAQEQLKIYRQSLLKHAFEGKLTEQWRKDNAGKLETPEQLLARIQTERETRYQQQLDEWKQAVKDWEAKGKEGKKPSKPAKPSKLQVVARVANLPWCFVNYEGVCELIRNGISAKPIGDSGTKIFRISAVRAMSFDLSDIRYINNEDGQYYDFFLKKGDLVFTRYNGTREYVGVCAEYKGDESHLYPDKLILTRLGVQSILSSFLEKAFATGISRNFIEEKIRTTAGQSGISGGDIKSTPIPICSLAEQQEIVSQLEEKLSIIEQNEKEIESALAKAELLRQSILKKAFSGQLLSSNQSL